MDVKAPLPDDDDNASIATSLPGLSPTASLVSIEAMHTQEPESDEPPPYSAVTQPVPQPVPQSVPQPARVPVQSRSRAPDVVDETSQQWTARDPRSSSTHSLTPEHRSTNDNRRKLLLIYLHGFMGDETSFQSFPAHVHNLLCVLLAETHVVHTKIYPRYRSRRAITAAAEDFSTWLSPHEGPNTDIVLLGHSMGGLVAAEVVLLNSDTTQPSPNPLRHNILGTLNFDVPFLGMHPGIIGSGISSIFRPAPAAPRTPALSPAPSTAGSTSNVSLTPTTSQSSSLQELPTDPNYNPMFPNDVRLPQRTGWQNAAHFLYKHGKNLRQAAVQVVNQHIEFGSCMYDFEGLKVRYSRVRMLEEDSAKSRASVVQSDASPPRVRFANYYTASTGRPKKPKKSPTEDASEAASAELTSADEAPTSAPEPDRGPTVLTEENPILYEEPAFLDTASLPPDYSDIDFTSDSESGDLDELEDLDPIDTTSRTNTGLSDASSDVTDTSTTSLDLPKPQLPMPPVFKPPMKPPFNKEAYKNAVKTYKHDVYAYHRAIVAYHQEMNAYRKQELKRIKMIRKRSMDSIASSIDSRKAELLARHEARKQEYNQRRADLNERLAKARENRKQLMELLRPRGPKTEGSGSRGSCVEDLVSLHGRKVERKALKTLGKDERKLAKAASKEDRKKARADSKALRRGRIGSLLSVASASSADGERSNSETLWELEPKPEHDWEQEEPDKPYASSSTALPPTSPPPPPPTRTAPALPIRQSSASTTQTSLTTATTATSSSGKESMLKDEQGKPKKDRKFCLLPPKSANGTRDPTWVRVYMEGVDEVGAHCGLFFPRGPDGNEPSDSDVLEAGATSEGSWSDRYAQFVGDVAERIEGWVLEDMTMRLVSAGEDMD